MTGKTVSERLAHNMAAPRRREHRVTQKRSGWKPRAQDGFSDGDDDSRRLIAEDARSTARRQLAVYAALFLLGTVVAVLWASGMFFYDPAGPPISPAR